MVNFKSRRIFTLKNIICFVVVIVFLYALAGAFYGWVVEGGDVGSLLDSVKIAKNISSIIQIFILGFVWWYWERVVVLPSNPKAHKALRDARNNICAFGFIILIILSII